MGVKIKQVLRMVIDFVSSGFIISPILKLRCGLMQEPTDHSDTLMFFLNVPAQMHPFF